MCFIYLDSKFQYDFIHNYTLDIVLFLQIIPEEHKISVLSDITLAPPAASVSEPGPPPKKIKLADDVCTQTSAQASTPRKKKLKRDIKNLKKRIIRRNTAIDNLKSLLAII